MDHETLVWEGSKKVIPSNGGDHTINFKIEKNQKTNKARHWRQCIVLLRIYESAVAIATMPRTPIWRGIVIHMHPQDPNSYINTPNFYLSGKKK